VGSGVGVSVFKVWVFGYGTREGVLDTDHIYMSLGSYQGAELTFLLTLAFSQDLAWGQGKPVHPDQVGQGETCSS
jgi:hypothetical protein